MNKMIVMDMDGTLLRSDGTCSEEIKEYLTNLKEEGYTIVLATGRCLEDAVISSDNAFFVNYIISNTESVIYNISTKKYILKKCIKKEDVDKIVSLFDEKTMRHISLVTINKYNRFTTTSSLENKFIHTIKDFNEINEISNEVINLCIFLKQNSYLASILDNLKNQFKNLDFIIMQDSFGNDKRIEVVPKGNNKSNAISKVAMLENLDKKDIICFGDGLNDIDMLKYCGVSVAMGNALEEVKNVCKYVTDTNDNDGIIKFLEKYLSSKENKIYE